MMMGMFLVTMLPLISATTWYPSMPGIMRSSRMRSGGSRRDQGERLLAAGGQLENEARRRQHHLEQLAVLALIVHDEDAGRPAGDLDPGRRFMT